MGNVTTQKSFLYFVVISLGVHALLFLSVKNKNIELPANAGNSISINIIEKVTHKKTTTNQKYVSTKVTDESGSILSSKSNLSKKTEKIITEKFQPEKDKSVQNQQTLSKISKPQNSSQRKQLASNSQATILSILKFKLKQSFYYPKLAKRKNWQGDVLLVFDVNTSGDIQNIEIQRSSGYIVLDDAAVDSLAKIRSITDKRIIASHSGLKLNVHYRLEES